MIKFLGGWFIIQLILLNGCSNSINNQPPKILLGQDMCDNCFMIINEMKYAAAVTLRNGEEKRFDDIGCMLSYINRNIGEIKYYWVNDFISGTSISAENALFVKSKNEVTPMGGGIVAFRLKENAERFAEKENVPIMKFNDLINNNKYHKE